MVAPSSRSPQTDMQLFEELDNYSRNLRKTALDTSLIIKKMNINSNEAKSLCDVLTKLEKSQIENFDDLLESLNNKFLEFNLSINKNKSHLNVEKADFENFLRNAELLANEAASLMKKAFELNKRK